MNTAVKFLSFAALAASSVTSIAQQVPKVVAVEHFTNTLCSICASRNPGLQANLAHYPQVLFVSIHPSSPYAGCTLSMANVPENDARTNFYGLYGSTPKVVVQGTYYTGAFTDSTFITSQLGQTTSFAMAVTITPVGTDSIKSRVVIRKVDTSSLSTLKLYACAVEDTLFFTSGNGESRHYNVFRKSFTGSNPVSLTVPTAVGDSIVYSQTIAANTAWNRNRVFSMAILQDASKNAVQAAKSANLPHTSSTGITELGAYNAFSVYPNPAGNFLQLTGLTKFPAKIHITDLNGTLLKNIQLNENTPIDISALTTGLYFISAENIEGGNTIKFLKK